MSAQGEAALLEALRAGQPAAFEVLLRAHGGRMLAVARRFLRDEEDARDAVQEAFLQAFRALAHFEGGATLGTWLHRIVVNACLTKLRTRRRRPEESLDELLPQFLEDGHHAVHPADWRETPEALLLSEEARAYVRECIDTLPESYRTVLLLRDIEELDTAETARLLELSENVVKVRLHRARQALRTLLDRRFGGAATQRLGRGSRRGEEPVPTQVPEDLLRAILARALGVVTESRPQRRRCTQMWACAR